MNLAIEYLRNMQVPNSGMRDNKSLTITCGTSPRVEGLIYVNTRSAARITTTQSETLDWAALLPIVSVAPALKKPVKIKLHDRMIRV